LRDPIIFGIDQKGHTANLGGRLQAPSTGREEELSSETAILKSNVHCQPCKAKAGNVVPRKTAANHFGSAGVFERGGAEAVEAEDQAIGVLNGKECFRSTELVRFSCMLLQEGV
jgi:hypothetical protein